MTHEQFLAALYTDEAARARFIDDPYGMALSAGLSDDDAREVARIDLEALRLAARSFDRKRRAGVPPALVGRPTPRG